LPCPCRAAGLAAIWAKAQESSGLDQRQLTPVFFSPAVNYSPARQLDKRAAPPASSIAMRIASGPDVGIGTTNPTGRLHVNSFGQGFES